MSMYNKLTKTKLVNLPIEKRLEAYNKVLELKNKNLHGIEIWKSLRREGLEIKYETILVWINGVTNPNLKLNIIKNFDNELSYLIGSILGDGCFYKVIRKGSYLYGKITFAVKDKELAEKFSESLNRIFGKKGLYNVRFDKNLQLYVVQCGSKHLVEVLSKPLSELRSFIEISSIDFLKGIFDSEGCITIRFTKNKRVYPRIFLTNSNLELIKYIKSLLENLNVNSNIEINTKSIKFKFIKDKFTSTNKTCYNLCIGNIDGVRIFNDLIGFTINKKDNKLKEIVKLIDMYGTDGAYQKLKNI